MQEILCRQMNIFGAMQQKILAISGSTRSNSSNQLLLQAIKGQAKPFFEVAIFNGIDTLPHFNPDRSLENIPEAVLDFRNMITQADGVIICTPEYVFSLPGSLKNAIEWCVATTVLSQKPAGLITAAASGIKAHEQLLLLMKTLESNFTDKTTLLLQGFQGKIDKGGTITDAATSEKVKQFIVGMAKLLG